VRRLAERALALFVLVAVAPVLAVCAAGIQLSSPGPVLYRARRVGRGGREFAMLKLRTMRVGAAADGRITGAHDARVVSRFGASLRRLKIDELPQLWNVVRGEMAIIGPRPEDPEIVRRCYTAEHRSLLAVLPGLASPGSLYCATHADRELPDADAERDYIEHVLPITTALDLFYVRHASWWYDLRIVGRTLRLILTAACGRQADPEPPERQEALS
jgi:lipopolysaccharide/colanic/teichoic acid biosynthesis glycosyltransferase